MSERVGDFLRSLRLPFPLEERATGALVVCACLSGEMHGLGLQMAALLLAATGCRILYVGTDVPAVQVAGLAQDLHVRAVAVSISVAHNNETMTAQIVSLRERLPQWLTVLVGGEGAPASRPGLTIIREFAELEAWARNLVTAI